MTKKSIFFYIDEKVCFCCHILNPLHSRLFKEIEKCNKKTNKTKIMLLTQLLCIYDYLYFKIIHSVLSYIHKKLESNM